MTDNNAPNTETPDAITALAKEIAAQLKEDKSVPMLQIRKLIELKGEPFVREQVAATLKVEESGGMMTAEGDRRRTIGGVFFWLSKEALTTEERLEVFPSRRHYQPPVRTIQWEERREILASMTRYGRIRTMQLVLRGQVPVLSQDDEWVQIGFQQTIESHPVQVYPRGVPAPPEQVVTWVVAVEASRWHAVIAKFDELRDEIVIEAMPFWDQTSQLMVMWSREIVARPKAKPTGEPPAPTNPKKFTPDKKKPDGKKPNSKKPESKKTDTQKPGAKTSDDQPSEAVPAPQPETKTLAPLPPAPPVPTGVSEKRRQLEQAAATLRERIAAKTAAGQKVSMEQTLLQSTEKQLEQLRLQGE